MQCELHPSEEVVGVCARCLKERLQRLKRKSNRSRRAPSLEIVYSSGSDSCLEFDEYRVKNFAPEASFAIEKRENIIARKRFLWLSKNSNKSGLTSAQKKERRPFFWWGSFFHRLRTTKEETKQETCVSHEDSFISIKFDGNERSPWMPSIQLPNLGRSCRTVGSSARNSSVSELNRPSWDSNAILPRPSWDGILSQRSSSFYYEKDMLKKDVESYYSHEFQDCNQQQDDNINSISGPIDSSSTPNASSSTVRWRTRMNTLFQMKWRMQDKGSQKISHIINDSNNYYPTQYPTSKIWNLSSLYHNSHNCNYQEPKAQHCVRNTSTKRANKKSWIRSLTSPKWSLH